MVAVKNWALRTYVVGCEVVEGAGNEHLSDPFHLDTPEHTTNTA